MREKELREVAECRMCGKAIGHTGLPLFWRVRIRRYGLKVDAISQQQGLAMMLGGRGDLAQIMGPDKDMAEIITDVEITLCERCATEKRWPVMALVEEKG